MAEDKPKDRMFVGPPVDGTHTALRIKSDGTCSLGTLSDTPQTGAQSLVSLDHVDGCEYSVREETRFTSMGGPAQVASDSYRKGWDNIFGKAQVGQA